jgi:hypothetical protein
MGCGEDIVVAPLMLGSRYAYNHEAMAAIFVYQTMRLSFKFSSHIILSSRAAPKWSSILLLHIVLITQCVLAGDAVEFHAVHSQYHSGVRQNPSRTAFDIYPQSSIAVICSLSFLSISGYFDGWQFSDLSGRPTEVRCGGAHVSRSIVLCMLKAIGWWAKRPGRGAESLLIFLEVPRKAELMNPFPPSTLMITLLHHHKTSFLWSRRRPRAC